MKALPRLIVIGILISFVLPAGLYAQETEGLIPKLIKKWKGAPKEAPAKAAVPVPSAPAAKQPAAPVMPAETGIPAKKPEAVKPAVASSAERADRTVISGLDKMTKEEMAQHIIETIESEDEVLNYIPPLKAEKRPDGKLNVTYEVKGQAVKLEDLDKDTLGKIYSTVHQISTKLSVERISQQLETIRQTQNIQRVAQPPQAMTVPAQPPRVPQSQAPPQQPPSAPSRVPQPPPQPPRR